MQDHETTKVRNDFTNERFLDSGSYQGIINVNLMRPVIRNYPGSTCVLHNICLSDILQMSGFGLIG